MLNILNIIYLVIACIGMFYCFYMAVPTLESKEKNIKTMGCAFLSVGSLFFLFIIAGLGYWYKFGPVHWTIFKIVSAATMLISVYNLSRLNRILR